MRKLVAGLDCDGAGAELDGVGGEVRAAAEHRHVVRVRSTTRLHSARRPVLTGGRIRANGGGHTARRSGSMQGQERCGAVLQEAGHRRVGVRQLTCSTLQR